MRVPKRNQKSCLARHKERVADLIKRHENVFQDTANNRFAQSRRIFTAYNPTQTHKECLPVREER